MRFISNFYIGFDLFSEPEVVKLFGSTCNGGPAGVGTDLIEISRVRQAVERGGRRFLERVYTEEEIAFCEGRRDRYACLAARFAAKEAVFKALGNGLAGCRWVDVEVCRTGGGRPKILLHGAAARLARENGIASVLISLSHSREHAVAFALAEREGV